MINLEGKVPAPPLSGRPASAPYFHSLYFFQIPPSKTGNENSLPPALKWRGGGGSELYKVEDKLVLLSRYKLQCVGIA